MAPLPPNTTGRYWVDYLANGREHTVMFRFPAPGVDGDVPPAFVAAVSDFLQSMEPFMPTDWQLLGARVSAPGSSVSLPGPAPAAVTGAANPQPNEAPGYITFVGRSATGRRVRVSLLGAGVTPAGEAGTYNDYRATAAENAQVATAIAQLDEVASVGIDGADVTWYTYVNLGYNAYWQRKVRG